MEEIIKVQSFPRSGTHFLMASLERNFDFGDVSGLDKGEFFPYRKLFGGHRSREFYSGRMLYIVRHPYPVFLSMHRLLETPCSFDEFANEFFVWSWFNHVKSFEGVPAVRYEDLCGDFEGMMQWIAHKFGMKLISCERPGPCGWNPSRNQSKVGKTPELFQKNLKITGLGEKYGYK